MVLDGPRYHAGRVDGRLGIIDAKGKQFAPFVDAGPVPVMDRVKTTVLRLNGGVETATGYVWEKM